MEKKKENPTDCIDSGELRRKNPFETANRIMHIGLCVFVCARALLRVCVEKNLS